MRAIISFAAFAVVASLIVPQYATRFGGARPVAEVAVPKPEPADVDTDNAGSRSVVVPANSRGHFEVEGRIDGRRIDFVVDTGASVIALTTRDADRLGVHPAQNEFTVTVQTANGNVRAAPVRLDRVEVGDLEVRDVAALVLPEAALNDNLLGLSFLKRLRHFEYSDGRMVLEQ